MPDARMPVIDHAGGIARLMGDSALFARVLERFRNEYRNAAANIRRALDDGDGALALRQAHTLKGAAAMIEARPLRGAAQALEQILRTGGDPHARLAQLDQALGQVLRELDAGAGNLPPARPAAPTSSMGQRDALSRLAMLLDEGNGDAVDLLREAESALRAELGDEMYDRVAAAIESFDFDGALAMLEEGAA
jgi:HPt (histidine-containing phosphotransfer) domain-containing protein